MKYSPPEKEIIMRTRRAKRELHVSVTDFGIGIPKNKQDQIFERFFRVHNEKNAYPGLGLGLYISKEIVTRQEGNISVKSEEGKNTTFTFTIPLRTY